MKRSWLKRAGFKKRKKKTERQKLIDDNDELVRQILRLRDKVCQYSGKTDNLQVSHFISRENLHLRWNLDNVVLINAGIHAFTFHKNPAIHKEFMVKHIGLEKVERFEMQNRIATKTLYTCDIEIIKGQLTKELERLKELL